MCIKCANMRERAISSNQILICLNPKFMIFIVNELINNKQL